MDRVHPVLGNCDLCQVDTGCDERVGLSLVSEIHLHFWPADNDPPRSIMVGGLN